MDPQYNPTSMLYKKRKQEALLKDKEASKVRNSEKNRINKVFD